MKNNTLILSSLMALAIVPGLSFAANTTAKPAITKSQHEKININTANLAAFQTVKGLGQKKAKAIIAYREQNGSFKTVDDLQKVPGIGEKIVAKLKPQLTVG